MPWLDNQSTTEKPILLFGVTALKTEVCYRPLPNAWLPTGQYSLVPEIALTPQMTERFVAALVTG